MHKKNNDSYYTNRHSCFLLCYRLVLVTKYKKPILTGNTKDTVYNTIKTIMEEKELHLVDINGEADHLHILFEARPDTNIAELVNVIKTKTSRFARRDNAEVLRKFYYKPLFWTNSYFVSTVGNNTKDIVKEYIENQ